MTTYYVEIMEVENGDYLDFSFKADRASRAVVDAELRRRGAKAGPYKVFTAAQWKRHNNDELVDANELPLYDYFEG